jgi:hypothetical protein
MLIGQIQEGDIVMTTLEIQESFAGLPIAPGTRGIVEKIECYDDVYVAFELGRRTTSQATLCHPGHLQPF